MIRNISIQFEVKSQNFGVMLDAIQKGKVMINADLSEVLALPDVTQEKRSAQKVLRLDHGLSPQCTCF